MIQPKKATGFFGGISNLFGGSNNKNKRPAKTEIVQPQQEIEHVQMQQNQVSMPRSRMDDNLSHNLF